jgi:hypothetical protein
VRVHASLGAKALAELINAKNIEEYHEAHNLLPATLSRIRREEREVGHDRTTRQHPCLH